MSDPIEDGRSAVSGTGRQSMTTGTKIGILGLVGVLALGFVWFNALYSHRAKQQQTQQTAYSGGGEQYTAPPPAAPPRPVPPALPMPAEAVPLTLPVGSHQQSPASAPILAFSGNFAPSQQRNAAPTPAGVPAPGETGSTDALGVDNSPLARRLKATQLEGEKAGIIANPNMTITMGTTIPCSLQTAIDSELPGLVVCVVPLDIRGTTGNVVLLDRGTRIVGQLQSGLLQGQNRVFVDWTRAETPDHVVVTLDSPGTDELGRSGLPGAVDNHFWERFGGALMLTLVQGALDAGVVEAANRGGGGGNSASSQAGLGFVYAAQSNGQTIANTALQNTINIPPTLTKNQGDTVGLIVAHDLDFSSVYRLQINAGAALSNGG
jgi:type IV secretion system protein VirB10